MLHPQPLTRYPRRRGPHPRAQLARYDGRRRTELLPERILRFLEGAEPEGLDVSIRSAGRGEEGSWADKQVLYRLERHDLAVAGYARSPGRPRDLRSHLVSPVRLLLACLPTPRDIQDRADHSEP